MKTHTINTSAMTDFIVASSVNKLILKWHNDYGSAWFFATSRNHFLFFIYSQWCPVVSTWAQGILVCHSLVREFFLHDSQIWHVACVNSGLLALNLHAWHSKDVSTALCQQRDSGHQNLTTLTYLLMAFWRLYSLVLFAPSCHGTYSYYKYSKFVWSVYL